MKYTGRGPLKVMCVNVVGAVLLYRLSRSETFTVTVFTYTFLVDYS